MSREIHNLIMNKYEIKRRAAMEDCMNRKKAAYAAAPELEEIEDRIKALGIRCNRMILEGRCSTDRAVAELAQKVDSLKRQREAVLKDAGFAADYLEMRYECPRCGDTGYIEKNGVSEKCICYRQQMINYLYDQSNLKLAQKENFSVFDETYYPDKANREKYGMSETPRANILNIKERCMKFIENFASPEEKNLFFSGPTGVGKTFMSNCIAMEIMEKGRTVLYQTAPRLFDIINEYKAKAFKEEEFEDCSYRNIFDVELLIIDDLGTEPQSAARFAELLNILNTRQINNLTRPCKTIISTNIETKDLYGLYTERVMSRIVGCFDMFRFAGEDIRVVKKSRQR